MGFQKPLLSIRKWCNDLDDGTGGTPILGDIHRDEIYPIFSSFPASLYLCSSFYMDFYMDLTENWIAPDPSDPMVNPMKMAILGYPEPCKARRFATAGSQGSQVRSVTHLRTP